MRWGAERWRRGVAWLPTVCGNCGLWVWLEATWRRRGCARYCVRCHTTEPAVYRELRGARR